jgi:hypothetical protein
MRGIKYYSLGVGIVITALIFGCSGTSYEKLHPNNKHFKVAMDEFKWACGKDYKWQSIADGMEYHKEYNSRRDAKRDFVRLAHMLDDIYANGVFLHLYIGRNEFEYRCCDKDRNRIIARMQKREDYDWRSPYAVYMFIETR